ncbi:bacteriocin-like peptide [Shewanella indica]|uniref:bacteriocin-like peptide n=1 Tax=Shewanella indica TaxID=768528 RepID=UPI001CFCCC2E|nr:bacteriocin-like peptide [Shewanella indica]
MQELTVKDTEIVNGGINSGVCSAAIVSGSALTGGIAAGYFSLGLGFTGGASAGAFFGGFVAAAVCYR